ncbi:MAG: hypothetical protein Ta2F_06650 [Termitinemataceae bacterium]|nr:MAG: hypothetical protein Ta2F_06650 [Termitinemataceae bacterium]
MVKKNYHTTLLCVFFLCCVISCEVDLAGFIASKDLDIRLEAANEFNFIKPQWNNFTTTDTYDFIVVSDTHIKGNDTHGLENLKNYLGDAAFVVVTGDITQSCTREELNRFIETANSFNVPCYPVIGNHDIYFGNWSVWRDLIGSTRYRIDTDSTTLFILDSANAFFGDDQINWMQNEMKTAKQNIFIFSHANLFSNNKPSPAQQQFTNNIERSYFISILDSRCKGYFSGHIHDRVINKIRETNFITLEDFVGNKTFCVVHVNTAGITWEFKQF